MICVGNDIVENRRIGEVLKKFGERFLKKIYLDSEIEYCQSGKNMVPCLSARFAVKEAFIKAMELEKGEFVDMKEIELKGTVFGKKKLVIHGKSLELLHRKGFNSVTASVSHSENYATAVVILYNKEGL